MPTLLPTREGLRWQRWCRVLVYGGALLALGACRSQAAADSVVKSASTATDDFSVQVDAAQRGRSVNRMILGSNLQWVDRGDDMFDEQGKLKPNMLALVQALHPSVLRYPGGAQADTYHWERGMGPLAQRGPNEHFNARRLQPTIVGTQEFLELCEATGAQPLITVNLASGTAEEAARWVALTNRQGLVSRLTGQRLPAVHYWEIGNEPYLKDEAQPSLAMKPSVFAQRAQSFIVAMRAVDPSIRVILPLTNDTRNGFPVTPYPGFTHQVLELMHEPFELVALHNAYMPFGMDKEHSQAALYWGAMAASRSVQSDFAAMRAQLKRERPQTRPEFALTEYNAIFTLGRGASDDWVAAPVAALYVADVLRVMASTPDLLLANFWSLSGNWRFGAIRSDGVTRPSYEVLRLYDELLQGDFLGTQVQAQTVATPSVGGSAAVSDLPLIESLATRQGQTLRLLLIHKDDTREGHGHLHLAHAQVQSATWSLLSARDPWQVDPAKNPLVRTEHALPASEDLVLDMPPHSVALLTLVLRPGP